MHNCNNDGPSHFFYNRINHVFKLTQGTLVYNNTKIKNKNKNQNCYEWKKTTRTILEITTIYTKKYKVSELSYLLTHHIYSLYASATKISTDIIASFFFLVCYSNACQAHQIVWVVMIHKLIYIIFKFSLQKWFSYGALGLHRVTNDWYISMKNKQITFRIIEKRFMKSEKFKNPVEIIGNHVSMVY